MKKLVSAVIFLSFFSLPTVACQFHGGGYGYGDGYGDYFPAPPPKSTQPQQPIKIAKQAPPKKKKKVPSFFSFKRVKTAQGADAANPHKQDPAPTVKKKKKTAATPEQES